MSLPVHNHLLAALPAGEFDHFASHLEPVTMAAGEVLCESGGQLKHVYLPTTAIVSLLYVLEDGATEEIGMVGTTERHPPRGPASAWPARRLTGPGPDRATGYH